MDSKNTKKEVKQKSPTALKEEETLAFWQENQIFQKTLQKPSPKGEFVFYDGPPFATGLPHYGHLIPGTIKDVIPRYKTMQGYHVRRQWGWDCHGLPLENIIEKELGLATKKDIETYGIDKFVQAAHKGVLRYADDWKNIIPRTGRWADMDNDYRTMDWTYTESIWWAFKTLFDKKLAYEGFKSMHLCPRCETTLSNFEVAQGYKDITDKAVTVKFKITAGQKIGDWEVPEDTFLLAWTTTPWTLPGNIALAVNEEVEYVRASFNTGVSKITEEGIQPFQSDNIILAKEILAPYRQKNKEDIYMWGTGTVRVIETFKGSDLVGLSYTPPFSYYQNADIKNKENAWKVYAGNDFVTTQEGTGIVHIAPAFGADDLALAQKHSLPLVHHVKPDGTFADDVIDFKGLPVKPKENHRQTDEKIIKHLDSEKLLVDQEDVTHSYPHCWRCDTPLLNYASSSWFVKVTSLKDTLIAENKKITWIPPAIGAHRFGDWLEGARDWAISRSRYWGAPLPVWKCDSCQKTDVLGSLDDLKEKTKKSGNTYLIMRHGGAEHNKDNTVSTKADNPHHVTPEGKINVTKRAQELKEKNIDLIIASPFVRTRETAEIVAEVLGIEKKQIKEDERIAELKAGVFEGRTWKEWHDSFSSTADKFDNAPEGGESFTDARVRMGDFLYELEHTHTGKTILIISHGGPLAALLMAAEGADRTRSIYIEEHDALETSEVRELSFIPLPHNETYELDLHRPYIDTTVLSCPCGSTMERIVDVFDCWFESGSMPYGQYHYPFENKDVFDPEKGKGFPAHFIAEGLDQTRGWFYSLLVLGVALFGQSPYRNVIVNGLLLAEDGRKMSKRLKNYPELSEVTNRYGIDALRYFLMNSPVTRAEDFNFSERGVDEVLKKTVLRLDNVVRFYELYTDTPHSTLHTPHSSKNVLDGWILARLNQLIIGVTKGLDAYELDRAARPIEGFIDDFSTWYIRRSRSRFKSDDENDKQAALATTRHVLLELSKVIAPFMPFLAEDVYKRVGGEKESVHLEEWPETKDIRSTKQDSREDVLEMMKEVREVVSLGLEARAAAKLKVRQPLQKLSIKEQVSGIKGNEQLVQLVKDEVNVKEVVFDDAIKDNIELDTTITPELKKEGQLRELIRAIQDLRKKTGLTPDDRPVLTVGTDTTGKDLLKGNEETITKSTLLKELRIDENTQGEEVTIDNFSFTLQLEK